MRIVQTEHARFFTIHIEAHDGLTYCGLVADEVWTGGPLTYQVCPVCCDGLVNETTKT